MWFYVFLFDSLSRKLCPNKNKETSFSERVRHRDGEKHTSSTKLTH